MSKSKGVNADWFSWFNKNKMKSFAKVLEKSLIKIEKQGINLGKIFSIKTMEDK